MPSNHHAFIRYRTIDRCLRSSHRDFFLNDLIQECTTAIRDYDAQLKGTERSTMTVSRRTVLYDLKFMKDPILGFGAPIESDKTDGYYYDDPNFQIFQSKANRSDIERLGDALLMLKQLSGEDQFSELESLVMRLEETYDIKRKQSDRSPVQFETSSNIEGQQWVSELSLHIKNEACMSIDYQPFGRDVTTRVISPYLIKEYNNRWFLIGWDHRYNGITNLGLDRVKSITISLQEYNVPSGEIDDFGKDIIGISYPKGVTKEKIVLRAHNSRVNYLETKPLHISQVKTQSETDSALFELELIPNYEFYSKIMMSADDLEIVSPKHVREEVMEKIDKASSMYS